MTTQVIDMSTWPRKAIYDLFLAHAFPFMGVTFDVDFSPLRSWCARTEVKLFPTTMHVLTHAAQRIPEFRTRIRGNSVVEHSKLDPSFPVPSENDLFTFCTPPWNEDVATFVDGYQRLCTQHVSEDDTRRAAERDDVLYLTSLPWIAFSHFQMPMKSHQDSIPRIALGKIGADGHAPVTVQCHHALVDGRHLAQYVTTLSEIIAGFSASSNAADKLA